MEGRSCPFLLPLLVLSSYSVCVHSEELSLTPIELAPVPCNDKAVGKLSRLAMTYINEDRPDGYKFALNRVANVHLHAQVSRAAQTVQEPACGCCGPLSEGDLLICDRGKVPENWEHMFLDSSVASLRVVVMRMYIFNDKFYTEIK